VFRIALAAAAVLFLVAPSQADAQIYYGYGYPTYGLGYGYGYSPYGAYYGGYYRPPIYNEYGYGYPTYNRPAYRPPYYQAPMAPSGTGGAFSGSRNNGNYWYWLQQQANQGKIPQSPVNRMMYGNR